MKSSLSLILGIVLGILIGWGIFSQTTPSQSESETAKTSRSIHLSRRASSDRSPTSHPSAHKSRTPSTFSQANDPLLQKIGKLRIPWNASNELQLARLNAEIAQLPSHELNTLLAELELLEEDHNLWSDPLESISKVAILRLIELEGFSALNDLAEGETFPKISEQWGDDIMGSGFALWVSQNPQETREWLLSTLEKAANDEPLSILDDSLSDEDILAPFILAYEQADPNGLQWLIDLTEEEEGDVISRISLEGKIYTTQDPTHITKILNEGISLSQEEHYSLIWAAMQNHPETTTQWVTDLPPSPQRDSALLKVGEQLLYQNKKQPTEFISWFFDQEISDPTNRKSRLETFQSAFSNNLPSIVDFTSIPGIPTSEHNVTLEQILNNPLRTAESPEQFLANLRKTAATVSNGQFSELIEKEIQDLGLEHPSE